MTEHDLKPGMQVRYAGNRIGIVEDWYLTSEHKVVLQVTVEGRESLNNVPLEKAEKV